MDMCGMMLLHQQYSEEPCDETSFGNNKVFCSLWFVFMFVVVLLHQRYGKTHVCVGLRVRACVAVLLFPSCFGSLF